mgnify:CR=1 FL=1
MYVSLGAVAVMLISFNSLAITLMSTTLAYSSYNTLTQIKGSY